MVFSILKASNQFSNNVVRSIQKSGRTRESRILKIYRLTYACLPAHCKLASLTSSNSFCALPTLPAAICASLLFSSKIRKCSSSTTRSFSHSCSSKINSLLFASALAALAASSGGTTFETTSFAIDSIEFTRVLMSIPRAKHASSIAFNLISNDSSFKICSNSSVDFSLIEDTSCAYKSYKGRWYSFGKVGKNAANSCSTFPMQRVQRERERKRERERERESAHTKRGETHKDLNFLKTPSSRIQNKKNDIEPHRNARRLEARAQRVLEHRAQIFRSREEDGLLLVVGVFLLFWTIERFFFGVHRVRRRFLFSFLFLSFERLFFVWGKKNDDKKKRKEKKRGKESLLCQLKP